MEEDRSGFFNPPLWRQRRTFILDILRKRGASTVLDYGCGEASVLSFLIPSTADPIQITKLAGVDICSEVLEEAVQACQPWEEDYEWLREQPLTIDIYQGSVDQFDTRLLGYDALICSEVIEHLYKPTLDRFLDITLGHYSPPMMIVTTPNSEYNINFNELQYGTPNAMFRHDDHKFEWTRQEFQEWCHEGATKYNYDVEFKGIGLVEGKRNDLSVGHCTQACIFTRRQQSYSSNHQTHVKPLLLEREKQQPHQLVKHIEFPYYSEPPLSDDQALIEIEKYIISLCQAEPQEDEDDHHTNRKANMDTQEKQSLLPLTSSSSSSSGEESYQDMKWDANWSSITSTDSENFINFDSTTETSTSLTISSSWDDYDVDYCYNTYIKKEQRKRYTRVPQRFPYSLLWDILRIRQVCKNEQRMLQILSDCTSYQIDGEDLIVLKAFEIMRVDDDDNIYDSHSNSDVSSENNEDEDFCS